MELSNSTQAGKLFKIWLTIPKLLLEASFDFFDTMIKNYTDQINEGIFNKYTNCRSTECKNSYEILISAAERLYTNMFPLHIEILMINFSHKGERTINVSSKTNLSYTV